MSDAPIGSPNKQLPPLLTTTRRGSTEKIITNTNNSKKSSNEDLTNLESLLESQKDSDTIKKQLPDFCSFNRFLRSGYLMAVTCDGDSTVCVH